MDERLDEVLSKYDFKVHQVTRVRGALCLDTDKGTRILKTGDASKRRIEFEDRVTKFLLNNGYQNVDYIIPNQEGMLVTTNAQGENFIVKHWFLGDECRVKEKEDLLCAMKNLAKLHNILKGCETFDEIVGAQEEESLIMSLERHNREMKRVSTYIHNKKQKNEFERCILKSFDEFYRRAEQGLLLIKSSKLDELEEKAKTEHCISHGNYTYHNVIIRNDGVATVNFDRAAYGFQLLDFYYFFRKVMEKNNWRVPLGDKLIREYMRYHNLDKQMLGMLGVLLYYPEKYWKILNHYYNNKKAWIADKDMDKLAVVCEQEWQKVIFLQQLFALSF
ncbi:MAG: CotS family spore coat protein [Velocimicrobium sp.]